MTISWITCIWSLTSGICLTLGAVHFLVWIRQRDQLANLVFSIAATAAAAYAFLDMLAMHNQDPAEYGKLWRWALTLGMLEGVLIVVFVLLHLKSGRLWLLSLICALRGLMLAFNFASGDNFYFSKITRLDQVPLLGEMISRPHGVLQPWAVLMTPSLVLIIIFCLDAAYSAAKRGAGRRAWVLGGLMVVGFSVALASYALYARGILPSTFSSQIVLLLILLMGYELSVDVLRAARLSRELLESQQRMRMAASAADLSFWEWDTVRDEIWVTDRGRERAGVDPSERIDFNRFLQAMHPGDREPTQRAARQALDVSGEFDAEYRVTDRDGAMRWVVARGQVERDAAGKPLRMRGVSVNITELKNAETELAQKRDELSHLSRVTTMSELSSSLAHELNQPLAIILTNAQAAQRLLAQDPPDIAETREILADIVSEDERAGEVIRGLRALLKPGQIELLPVSMNDIIEDVLRIVRSDLIARGVTVHATLAGNMPQVSGDRIQLQQVLLNLILNGSDAMATNPPARRKLAIATVHRDAMVRISISDNGCGLPADPEQIFQPFYTTKKNGLGLGLAICRSIATVHQGRLWAETHAVADDSPDSTAAGRGTTLHLELPAMKGKS